MARQVPNAARQEGGPTDRRDKHGLEAPGKGQHRHQHAREMGCFVTTMEAAQECSERTSVHRG